MLLLHVVQLEIWFDFRISPRSSKVLPNPEEPEGEDEDVQMERMRTASAVTIPDSDEVHY